MELPDTIRVTLEVARVFEQLRIHYLVGGSVASSIYGHPRSTLDSDLVADLQPRHVQELAAALSERFYIEPERVADAIRRRASPSPETTVRLPGRRPISRDSARSPATPPHRPRTATRLPRRRLAAADGDPSPSTPARRLRTAVRIPRQRFVSREGGTPSTDSASSPGIAIHLSGRRFTSRDADSPSRDGDSSPATAKDRPERQAAVPGDATPSRAARRCPGR